ncbi:MAG: hypothetical protein ACLTPN_07395 [Clostridia bacterium]|mgnify:FL=1|nr:hypothetical protein [Clostridium sp.]
MEQSENITQVIIDTINTIIGNLFSSIDNSLYSILDKITFIDSSILNNNNFENIFGKSTSDGILLIANSLLIGFLIYYSAKYLMSHLVYSNIERPSSFLIKLIVCGIFMNCSFFIMDLIISLNFNISSAICDLGYSFYHKDLNFSELINIINDTMSIDKAPINIFSLDGLIKGILTVSLLSLVFSYSLRYVMLKVFILLSPFAFLSLSISSTSWFFKSWFKNIFSLLFIQIIVSLVLLVLFSMDFSSTNLFNKFIYIGGIYFLIRANSFVREFIGGVSTDISQNVKNFFKNR